MGHGLPCKRDASTVSHFVSVQHFNTDSPRHYTDNMRALLASGSSSHCKSGQVPLLSLEAIHQLHIFIFVLAITHVVLSLITVILGITQIEKWKHWERKIRKEDNSAAKIMMHHNSRNFIEGHYRESEIISWLEHCKKSPNFDFYDYMIRALEYDYKKIVGISPKLVLFLIHFILFQNAFEIAYFFWTLTTYGFHSCIMDQTGYIVPRLIISVIVQIVCSYITLPLYAIVSHMGSRFNKAIFPHYVLEGLDAMLERIRSNPPKEKKDTNGKGLINLWRRTKVKNDINGDKANNENHVEVQTEMHDMIKHESDIEEGIPAPAKAKEEDSSNELSIWRAGESS
ncbi:hypothetical protein LUZ60_004394 [Juncus effusus]|nr:hypothetical protein LUZ60_004394 [Juncus effusus]